MKLPNAVSEFFEADRRPEVDALKELLSAIAVVEDEGASYKGVEAIGQWRLAAKQKYQHVAEPIEASQAGETVRVRARVTGSFPSSPAILQYEFTLRGDKIARLRIGV